MGDVQKRRLHTDYALIAQISDLHLLPLGSYYNGERDGWHYLAAAIKALNTLSPRPDYLVVSGDLADKPDRGVYIRLLEELQSLEMPSYLFPGNHDDRELFRDAFALVDYIQTGTPFIQFTIETAPLRSIILDSMDSHGGAMLCPDRLNWLRQQLDDAPTRPTILFMHHQPYYTRLGFTGTGEAFPGIDELRSLLKSYDNVAAIACGHLHRSIQMSLGNVPVSVAPSITYQRTLTLDNAMEKAFINEPVGMLLHLWQPNIGIVTHTHFVGDFGPSSPMLG